MHLKFQIWDYIVPKDFLRIFAKIVIEMAKPIKETPILTGKDAERFVSEMQRVDNLSAEQRKSNYAQLMAQYKDATRNIEICL